MPGFRWVHDAETDGGTVRSVLEMARGASYEPAESTSLLDVWTEAEAHAATGLPDGADDLGVAVTAGVVRARLLRHGLQSEPDVVPERVLCDLRALTLAPAPIERHRAELRLRLALTYLDVDSDTFGLLRDVVDMAAPSPRTRGARRDPSWFSMNDEGDLAVGWVSVCGPDLLRALAHRFRDLGTASSGKPPRRAQPIRLAQRTALVQLARARVLHRADLAEMCGVRKQTVDAWIAADKAAGGDSKTADSDVRLTVETPAGGRRGC